MTQQQFSEVAWLRAQLEKEHECACFARSGLSVGTAQHWFITRRMQRMDSYQQRLSTLIGEQQSVEVIMDIMERSPTQKRTAIRH